jgi:4-hydroxybenzoate polyprenyltransferase
MKGDRRPFSAASDTGTLQLAQHISAFFPIARAAVRAARPHQWLKNLLVLVPALAAHRLGGELAASLVAFISFSLCASGIYILNDLSDLSSDRAHPRKKFRPLASGELGTGSGRWISLALLLASVAISLVLPFQFLLILLTYFALASAYTLILKKIVLVDVIVLVSLYGVRLAAGEAASSVPISPWLALFSFFLFLCLALVKRCVELADKKASGGTIIEGRGYSTDDLAAIFSIAIGSGVASSVVLALYLTSDVMRSFYTHPEWMWIAWLLFGLWMSRVLLFTHRGKMHDDPVAFAASDRLSITLAFLCGLIVVLCV